MASHFTIIYLPTFSDPKGVLTVMEKKLPFTAFRTFWIYGSDGQTRGGHRHTHNRQAFLRMSVPCVRPYRHFQPKVPT